MYKSFQMIADFMNDVWGYDFLQEATDEEIRLRLDRMPELKNACDTMSKVVNERRKPSIKELVDHIYPLLEVSFQWSELKRQGRLTDKFMEKCKGRISNQEPGNFYGTIFELDFASRCLLSGWNVEFSEEYNKEGKQIDFVVFKGDAEVFGIECSSKRYTANLTEEGLGELIEEKARKFEPEYISKLIRQLGTTLDKKLLVVDLTRERFVRPEIIDDLGEMYIDSNLDAIVLTWREDVMERENHSLIIKYRAIGNITPEYFSMTYAAEIHLAGSGPVFFIRKFVEPEPTWGSWGPEEARL